MKTLLFDSNSGKVISPIFEDGYRVDDQPQPVDPVYRSLIDANVWSPADYPAGWELVP